MTTKKTGKTDSEHFNREPRRKAEFIKPVNQLQSKVGYGGIDEKKLQKAETVIEKIPVNFKPMAQTYLDELMKEIVAAKKPPSPARNGEDIINRMLDAATHLKAGGGMCGHKLIAKMADKLIQFLEVIDEPNKDATEIAEAFHKAILLALGNKDAKGEQELLGALDAACWRYFEHHPGKRT
jgi:LPS sulfotransferase NodH